ncbi:MAG: IS1 family transposase [Methylobacter sp.]|nr:IS1 family transposase [Methylobacter sp.]
MICYQEITCPACGGNDIMKSGRSAAGTQRYHCRNPDCTTKTFMLAYRYKACEPGIKEQVMDMSITVAVSAIQHGFLKSTKTQ